MRKSLVVLVPMLSVFAAAFACSSKKPNPPVTPTATSDGGADGAAAGDGGLALAPTDGGGGAADAAPVATGPTFFTGDGGSGASSSGGTTAPVLTEQALDSAIDLAITTASPKLAPKMDREGAAGRATLKEGEHFSMMITLAPNRCYTFIGFSPPGSISQLDIKLYAPPLFNVESGKSSAADKAMPTIGKGTAAMCPILPIAVPYKIDVAATKGAGRMGVQVFARNK